MCKNCGCAKGHTGGAKAKNPPDPTQRTFAAQQLAVQKAVEKAERKCKQQEETIRKLQKERDAQPPTGVEEYAMDTGDEQQPVDNRGRIQILREQISYFETQKDDAARFAEVWEQAKAELLVLQQQQVAARPLSQRLRDIDAKIERKEKAIRKKQDEEVPKLQKVLDKAAADLEEASGAIKKLQEELKEARSDREQLMVSPGKDGVEEAKEQNPNEKLEHGFRLINEVLAQQGGTVVELAQATGTPKAELERLWNGMEKLFRTAVGPAATADTGGAQEGGTQASAQEVPVADDLPDAAADADGSTDPGKDHDQPGLGDFEQLLDVVMQIADPEERAKRKGELLRAAQGPKKSSRR